MKKLLILLAITGLLASCNEFNKPYIITHKAYNTGYNKAKLPLGICYFIINGNTNHIFQDSCNKYNIGDTIK